VSLLDGIDKLIADVAGPLLFERASLLSNGGYSIDAATGQTVSNDIRLDIKALEADYSAFHRASLSIPSVQRKISVIGYGVTMPIAGDRIALRGIVWEVVSVSRDPAGALYVCHSVPIGVDPLGDPGPTQNILSGVAGIVYEAAGPLLFTDAVMYTQANGSLDSYGQFVSTGDPQDCAVLEADYTTLHRASKNIPETHRKLLVLGYGLSEVPKPGDKIDLEGLRWEIVETSRDPAGAVYSCQSKPIGLAVVVRFAEHRGRLARTLLSAMVHISFTEHRGVLSRVSGSASVEALIASQHAGQLSRVSGAASAVTLPGASHAGLLSRAQGVALANAIINATSAGTLARVTPNADLAAIIDAQHAGTLARITGEAIASGVVGRDASHAGTLAKVAGGAVVSVDIDGQAANTLAKVAGVAIVGAAEAAQSASTLARLSGSAEAQTLVSAQSEGTLSRATSSQAAAGAIQATHAGALARISGVAQVAGSNQATQAGTLARLSGSASAAAIIAATQAGTLAKVTGTAAGEVVAGGPTFESGVIHAWDPDAGADASGIIADAVGSANMWARDDLSAATSWSGEMAGEALVVDHADVTDFKIAAATLTFWMYENGPSPAYSPLVHLANTGASSTGDWRMSRNGGSSDQQNYVYTGYDAGANGKNPRECPTGQWNLWTIRLGAGTWRVLGNSAVQLSSTSWVTASFAGNTRPLSLGSNENISDHTGGVYSDFRGRFGDVRMWDKSLSDAEISALHTAGRQSY
jgi:hypothetical protein